MRYSGWIDPYKDDSSLAMGRNSAFWTVTPAAPDEDSPTAWHRDVGTTTRNVCWASGASMAAPALSGVAALIVGKLGSMNPDELANRLASSAADLGATGTDPIYGRGRVNALRAVQ